MTEPQEPRANGSQEELARLGTWAAKFGAEVLGELKHQAEALDDVRDQARAQIAAEARRTEIYQQRWEVDHEQMTALVSELAQVRKSLGGLAAEFKADHDALTGALHEQRATQAALTAVKNEMEKLNERLEKRIEKLDDLQRESRRTDAILAALTAVAMVALRMWGNQP